MHCRKVDTIFSSMVPNLSFCGSLDMKLHGMLKKQVSLYTKISREFWPIWTIILFQHSGHLSVSNYEICISDMFICQVRHLVSTWWSVKISKSNKQTYEPICIKLDIRVEFTISIRFICQPGRKICFEPASF